MGHHLLDKLQNAVIRGARVHLFPLMNIQPWLTNAKSVFACVFGVERSLPAAVKQKRVKLTGARARVQEKVRGHFTVVCGYINVCSDLRLESILCSSASGRQRCADRHATASLLQNLHFSICSAVTYSFHPSVCFSFYLAPTPPCRLYLLHTVFLLFLRPTLHKPKPHGSGNHRR